MLERIGDWYRVATPKPDHEMLEKRRKIIMDLVPILKKETSLILGSAAGLVWHFDADSEIYKTIVQASQEHDLRFPTSIDENENEIKVMSALALGEIMANSKPGDHAARLSATVLISALGVPRKSHQSIHHFSKVLVELQVAASKLVAREAAEIRAKSALTVKETVNVNEQFKKIKSSLAASPQDPTQAWVAISPALKQMVSALQRQVVALRENMRLEREELNTLWWAYSGRSSVTNEYFSGMKIGAIVLCSGSEIADLLIAPPPGTASYLLEDIVRHVRKGKDIPDSISLKDIVPDWDHRIVQGTNSTIPNSDIVKNYPELFPTSWIALRLLESEMSAGWTKEFEKKTGINVGTKLGPIKWAEQVMWERVAQEVYEN